MAYWQDENPDLGSNPADAHILPGKTVVKRLKGNGSVGYYSVQMFLCDNADILRLAELNQCLKNPDDTSNSSRFISPSDSLAKIRLFRGLGMKSAK